MTNELQNTMIRELSFDELSFVSGGTRSCAYEVANRCYAYRAENFFDWFLEQVNRAAGL